MVNPPKRHHYVPKLYLRQFVRADDANKVLVLARRGEIAIAERKSIGSIGYEEGLHDFMDGEVKGSIEAELNETIETPFSRSATWSKIESRDFASLDADDGLSIYGFARHLHLRNVTMLRFMQKQHERFLANRTDDLNEEERAMHARIERSPGGPHQMFRAAALDKRMPTDASAINVMVCNAETPFRSSTNPTLMVSYPGTKSIMGDMFGSLRTWWLSLDPHWGVFIVAGGPPGFSIQAVPDAVARVINQRFLIQLLRGDARHMLADDPFLEFDLDWAGFALEQRTSRGFRYRATTWRDHDPEAAK